MSKRFELNRFLGLSEEEMAKNSTLWAEENAVAQKKQTKTTQLRTGGISQAGVQSDLDQFENPTPEEGAAAPGSAPVGPGSTPPAGGTPGTTPGGGATI
jgi:hypothetical protein